MANHGKNDENYTSNPGVMYETSDANARAIYIFGIWLAILGGVCAVAAYGGLRAMEAWEDRQDKARIAANPMVPESRAMMPSGQAAHEFPTPQLQVNDTAEMQEEVEQENAKLSHYQWVDENQGIVSIPIDRAMQLVLQRGLPTRAPGETGTPAAAKPAAKPAGAKKPAANAPGKPASQQVR